jgi:hypothetical protein
VTSSGWRRSRAPKLYGDTLPLDANRGTGQDKIGFTLHAAGFQPRPRTPKR